MRKVVTMRAAATTGVTVAKVNLTVSERCEDDTDRSCGGGEDFRVDAELVSGVMLDVNVVGFDVVVDVFIDVVGVVVVVVGVVVIVDVIVVVDVFVDVVVVVVIGSVVVVGGVVVVDGVVVVEGVVIAVVAVGVVFVVGPFV